MVCYFTKKKDYILNQNHYVQINIFLILHFYIFNQIDMAYSIFKKPSADLLIFN